MELRGHFHSGGGDLTGNGETWSPGKEDSLGCRAQCLQLFQGLPTYSLPYSQNSVPFSEAVRETQVKLNSSGFTHFVSMLSFDI